MMRILLLALLLTSIGCGKNIFESYEKKDAAEDATVAMENHNPGKAIAILQDALENDPENYQLLSLLAAATAQKYGIDTISLALELATPEEESADTTTTNATSTNGITGLFDVLPDATDENIAGVQSASDILMSIPDDSRTRADNFYLTLLNTALVGLHTKKFDLDGDGQVSPVELLTLSDDDAISILENLINAQDALANGMTDGQSSETTSGSISGIRDQIDSQAGDTDAEKLRNYLGGSTPAA